MSEGIIPQNIRITC